MFVLKTKREKKILYMTLGLIAFALILEKLIFPLLEKNNGLDKEICASRLELGRYARLIAQQDYIREKYALFNSGGVTPPASGNGQMGALSQLESLAVGAGVRIIDIRPQAAKARGSYQESLIEIKTEGQMEGYLKFIYDIEGLPTTFKIKKFHLNARTGAQALAGNFSILYLSEAR